MPLSALVSYFGPGELVQKRCTRTRSTKMCNVFFVSSVTCDFGSLFLLVDLVLLILFILLLKIIKVADVCLLHAHQARQALHVFISASQEAHNRISNPVSPHRTAALSAAENSWRTLQVTALAHKAANDLITPPTVSFISSPLSCPQ